MPRSDIVCTVRRASVTARPATSVERVACCAIPALEAARKLAPDDPRPVQALERLHAKKKSGPKS